MAMTPSVAISSNAIDLNKKVETQNLAPKDAETPSATRRTSSVGAAFKRLFSTSPAADRSASATSELPAGTAGKRGRTPPKLTTKDSPEVQSKPYEELYNKLEGGLLAEEPAPLMDGPRFPMAPHRGENLGGIGGRRFDMTTHKEHGGTQLILRNSQRAICTAFSAVSADAASYHASI